MARSGGDVRVGEAFANERKSRAYFFDAAPALLAMEEVMMLSSMWRDVGLVMWLGVESVGNLGCIDLLPGALDVVLSCLWCHEKKPKLPRERQARWKTERAGAPTE